ncbi:MAG: PEP-CTERM sorting domain-containing protein [Planctomycetota bacterium]
MKRYKLSQLVALLAVLIATAGQVQAAVVSYSINVQVTAAPNAPGASTPWSFTSLPSTFVGTFDADDTAPGPISNLSLSIGGVDIVDYHTLVQLKRCDPTTLTLSWVATDPTNNITAVGLGSYYPGMPSDYAVGLEGTGFLPADPYYGSTQNWVGTFTINPSSPVPEPSTLAVFGIGVCAAGIRSARRRRREKQQETTA